MLASSAFGCWYDEPGSSRRTTNTPANPTPAGPTPRMSVDTGRTLHASPGQGVGLFITYQAGGQWKLEWSCDTNVSRAHSCNFELAVGTHAVSEIASMPSSAIIQKDAQSFHVRTVTTTTLDSATFKTDPGAAIALTMRVDGQVFPKLMFFVSGGELSTAAADPIELVPTDP